MKPFFNETDFSVDYSRELRQDMADRANRLLEERGKVVYGHADDPDMGWTENLMEGVEDTHQALLINIQIEQDSAENFLKDFMNYCKSLDAADFDLNAQKWNALKERAKALYSKESK